MITAPIKSSFASHGQRPRSPKFGILKKAVMVKDTNKQELQKAYINLSPEARASLNKLKSDAVPVIENQSYPTTDQSQLSAGEPPALAFAGEYDPQPSMAASNNTNTISDDDVARIMADIAAKYKGLTADQLQKIRAVLDGSIGTSRDNLSELEQQAQQAAKGYAEDNSPLQNLTPEQKLEQIRTLMKDSDAQDKDIKKDLWNYMTPQERAQYEALLLQKKKAEEEGNWRLAHNIDEKIIKFEEPIINRIDPDNAKPGEHVSQQQTKDHTDAKEHHEKKKKDAKATNDIFASFEPEGKQFVTKHDGVNGHKQGVHATLDDVTAQSVGQSQRNKDRTKG